MRGSFWKKWGAWPLPLPTLVVYARVGIHSPCLRLVFTGAGPHYAWTRPVSTDSVSIDPERGGVGARRTSPTLLQVESLEIDRRLGQNTGRPTDRPSWVRGRQGGRQGGSTLQRDTVRRSLAHKATTTTTTTTTPSVSTCMRAGLLPTLMSPPSTDVTSDTPPAARLPDHDVCPPWSSYSFTGTSRRRTTVDQHCATRLRFTCNTVCLLITVYIRLYSPFR